MNWRKRLFPFLLTILTLRLSAQLPDDSIAPDFTAQDILGQTHHLYDILDSGKIVIIEISATWCAPCWVYHTSHALQDLYAAHGPAGDDKLRIFWIEGDPATNLNCIYNQAGCNVSSAGNYVTGTPYPIIDNSAIAEAFQITYYPSIFVICPNKRTLELAPLDAERLWEKASQCPVAYGSNNAGIFEYATGTNLQELCGTQNLAPTFALTNLGNSALTAATIELKWNGNLLQTYEWSGNLNTYEEAQITLDNQLVSGAGLLKATIVGINNGTGDEDFSNNVRNDNFMTAQQFNSTKVLMKIRTDDYGAELYWELWDDAGNVLEHGGNEAVGPNGGGAFPLGVPIGAGAYPSTSIIRDTLELPTGGCYSIHFTDAYGDGICCDFGAGYYRLFNLDNPSTPLIAGGDFEAYSRRAFGATGLTATETAAQIADIQLFPNPASERMQMDIQTTQADTELSGTVYNALGQLHHMLLPQKANATGNDWEWSVADWPEGVYYVQLKIGARTLSKTFVVNK